MSYWPARKPRREPQLDGRRTANQVRCDPGKTAVLLQQIEAETTNQGTGAQSRRLLVIACLALFAAGLARYWVSYDPSSWVPRSPESLSLAYNLYEKGQFGNPFEALATGPSAHTAPMFPAFLALLMKVFGDGGAGLYAMQLAAAVILSLQLAFFPLFSEMLGMGTLNGFLAGSIWIVAKVENYYMWESFYASLLLAIACCCYRRYLDSRGAEANRLGWTLGCLMGLSILVAPALAPIFAVWLAWEIWRSPRDFWKRSFLPLVLMPALVIAPWMIRNYRVFHHYVFIRDDLGLELSVSNDDCAQYGISLNIISGCFFKTHPNVSMEQAERVLELGEVEYNRLQLRDALRWITHHPTRFMKLTAMRFVAFWIPNESGKIFLMNPARLAAESPSIVEAATARDDSNNLLTTPARQTALTPKTDAAPATGDRRLFQRAVIYLMTLLSVVGLVLLYRQDLASMAVCMSCLTFFPLIYYAVEFEDRYRYPILWVTFLLGTLPITTFVRHVRRTWFGAA
jgi:hypothetical protein